MKKYSVTLKQQLLVLLHLISSQLLIFLVNTYILGNPLSNSWTCLVFFIFLFVQGLPTMLLHIQYLQHDFGRQLKVDMKSGLVTVNRAEKNVEFALDDIQQLQYFVSFGRHTGVYSFAIHCYFKIILRNDSEVIITCLMMNDIEKTLPVLLKKNYEEKPRVFCFLPLKKSSAKVAF